MSEILHNPVEYRKRRPHGIAFRAFVALAIAAGGGAVAYGGTVGVQALNRMDERDRQKQELLSGEVDAQARLDGFTGAVIYYGDPDNKGEHTGTGILRVTPNCSLGDVAMTYNQDAGGHVTDISEYSFDTTLNGVVTQRNVGNRRVEEVKGQPVTFTFDNAVQLQDEVLGSQPCATLAQNVDLINRYPR